MSFVETATAAGRVALDPALGNIRALTLRHGGREIAPLHHAPWLDDPAVQADDALAPVERRLSGDFFCAPFGASDLEPAPIHGWPANSAWQVLETGGPLRLALERPVIGARIEKTLRLADDAPLLYQDHVIADGEGALTVAHHPMVRLKTTGRFCCSPKRIAISPDAPLEPGRHVLAPGAATEDLTAFPGVAGPVDLTALPIGTAHEDFVTLVEDGQGLGWSAVIRVAEDDIVFLLKDARVLPVTMLWHSNGGRDYSPWNGRHRGVLGIEDGCAAGAAGHRAALGPNPVAATGVPTALPLAPGRRHRIAHVIGAVVRPTGWTVVRAMAVDGDRLTITGDRGALTLPFRQDFFPA